MNIILNNAKAIFTKKFWCRSLFCAKVIVKFEKNIILFYLEAQALGEQKVNSQQYFLAYEVEFDASYVNDNLEIDCRYFSDIFNKAFQAINCKSKFFRISLLLPSEWILQANYLEDSLPAHQIERNVIYFFQRNYHVNIKEYDFFIDPITLKAIAVKKVLVQNFYEIFSGIKLYDALKFLGNNEQ